MPQKVVPQRDHAQKQLAILLHNCPYLTSRSWPIKRVKLSLAEEMDQWRCLLLSPPLSKSSWKTHNWIDKRTKIFKKNAWMNNGIPENLREKSGNSGAVREEWQFHVKTASEHSWRKTPFKIDILEFWKLIWNP